MTAQIEYFWYEYVMDTSGPKPTPAIKKHKSFNKPAHRTEPTRAVQVEFENDPNKVITKSDLNRVYFTSEANYNLWFTFLAPRKPLPKADDLDPGQSLIGMDFGTGEHDPKLPLANAGDDDDEWIGEPPKDGVVLRPLWYWRLNDRHELYQVTEKQKGMVVATDDLLTKVKEGKLHSGHFKQLLFTSTQQYDQFVAARKAYKESIS